MDILLSVVSAILVVGLIFFMTKNAIKSSNYKKKALVYFLVGFVLLLGCLGAYIYDLKVNEGIKVSDYYIFPGTIIVYMVLTVTVCLVKAGKYNHHFRKYRHMQSNDLDQFVYILFKNKDNYFLKEEDGKYKGDIIKYYRGVFFHDEMINKYIEKLSLNINSFKYIGEVNKKVKSKKQQYFCYLINIDELEIDKFKKIDFYSIADISAESFDKQVILRIVIGNEFKIDM